MVTCENCYSNACILGRIHGCFLCFQFSSKESPSLQCIFFTMESTFWCLWNQLGDFSKLLRQLQHQLSANNYVQTYCNIRGTFSKFGLDNVQCLTVISSTVIISFFQRTFCQSAAIWHGTHLRTLSSLKGLSLAKFRYKELALLVTVLINAYLWFCLSFLYIITANFHFGPEHCLWELSDRNAQQMANFLSNCKWSARKGI